MLSPFRQGAAPAAIVCTIKNVTEHADPGEKASQNPITHLSQVKAYTAFRMNFLL